VSLFEPVDRNAKALGYNVLSVPVTRDAFEQSRREDKMVDHRLPIERLRLPRHTGG